jgi:multidrug efflux pump subunit AcrB
MAHERTPTGQRNVARYFTVNRQVGWALLLVVFFAGVFGYLDMPKRKDPEIAVRVAAVVVAWPGAPADRVEDLVTRRIEEKIAENPRIEKIESMVRTGMTVVQVTLQPDVDKAKELDDIKGRLDAIHDLPLGTSSIQFLRDFGDTTALMLTVASPIVPDVEVELRAATLRRRLAEVRKGAVGRRGTLVYAMPVEGDLRPLRDAVTRLGARAAELGLAGDPRLVDTSGFVGVDVATDLSAAEGLDRARRFMADELAFGERHPDVWEPFVIGDLDEIPGKLRAVAGSRYSYKQLDDLTRTIKDHLQGVPEVSKVERSAVLGEQVTLDFSQEKLASYGIPVTRIAEVLAARNVNLPGGVLELSGKSIGVDPSGELRSEKEIGDVVVGASTAGAPVYLRDLVDVRREYQNPPRYLNTYTRRGPDGRWQTTRAITLAVYMRSGEQIGRFGAHVDDTLAKIRPLLPDDLVLARTSDQPRQVEDNVDLFMTSLYEAIALVVVIALIGFWDLRSAALMALTIPITLAMTFGVMRLLGWDVQMVSIASLIIALGLLVDVPVVAGDAIKNELADGRPAKLAAWIGPTRLFNAIFYATLTNVAAYIPFLALTGDYRSFLVSLPVVLTTSLVASLVVAMTFIPLLGLWLLRAPKKRAPSLAERRSRGFGKVYARVAGWAIDNRWKVLAGSLALVAGAGLFARDLKLAFFPKDLAVLSYVDVWLPEDAPLSATAETAARAEEVVRETLTRHGKEHPEHGKPREVLRSITTFLGGGGPRFWFSVVPELSQPNYAQLVIEVNDKHDTAQVIPALQRELSARVPGARMDVRQLETAKPVPMPVAVRVAGEDPRVLRKAAERVKDVIRAVPGAERVRDDWGSESFSVKLSVDPDRASLAGVTNLDVARSSATALGGARVGALREGDQVIPIVARLRPGERSALADVQNLYVNASMVDKRVPLGQVSRLDYEMTTEKLRRRNHFRTITVGAMPADGVLPSEIMNGARAGLAAAAKQLPPGYSLEIGGSEEEQKKGFKQLFLVLGISVVAIYLSLLVQFKNAVKPLIVFAAIPYGAAGAAVSLRIMNVPFGFMAFLGIISLIGVIVSHVIVLFDFIEEHRALGAPLREALIDAGIQRLRPVLITVAATVFALFPLASHGGPLWEPLCYAQIGGLTVATAITLIIVPVIYAIFILDLRLVRWGVEEDEAPGEAAEAAA